MISADVAENSDNIAEHSDNIAEISDNIAENSDNITKNAIDIASFNSSGKSFISEVLNHLFFKCILSG